MKVNYHLRNSDSLAGSPRAEEKQGSTVTIPEAKPKKPRKKKLDEFGYPLLPTHKDQIFDLARAEYDYPVEDMNSVYASDIIKHINEKRKESPRLRLPFR